MYIFKFQGFTGDSDLLRSAISCFITPSQIRETTDDDLFENIRSSLRGLFLRNRPSRAFFGTKVKTLFKSEIPKLETFSGNYLVKKDFKFFTTIC